MMLWHLLVRMSALIWQRLSLFGRRASEVEVAFGSGSGDARPSSGGMLVMSGLQVSAHRAMLGPARTALLQCSGCISASLGRRQSPLGRRFGNGRAATRCRSGEGIATFELRVCVVRAMLAAIRAQFGQRGLRLGIVWATPEVVWATFWQRVDCARARARATSDAVRAKSFATFGLRVGVVRGLASEK